MTDFPPPQATLLQLFERETKREKVLDGIYREKLIKLRADQTLSAARENMRVLKAEMELKIEEGIRKAEIEFFDSIEKDLQSRREIVNEYY